MHSFTDSPPDGICPTTFNYNADLSGMVNIDYLDHTTQVRGDALLAFMAHWLRIQRITAAEQAPDHEVLGIPPQGPT